MKPDKIRINKCAPSNDGNVGNAILCLSRRISGFAKELSGIQQELENLVQTETQLRQEQLTQEQNRATEKENSLEENISQINENIQQTNESNSEAFQSVTDFINQETQNRENAIQQQEQRAIEAENNLADLITQESTRALQAEEILQRAIQYEENRARSVERGLRNSLDFLSNEEKERAQGAEQTLTDKINQDVFEEKTRAENAEQALWDKIVADILEEQNRAKAAEQANTNDISAIEDKIPGAASRDNQLADKRFVNNSIATATATFHGTKNLIDDLSLTTEAIHSDIELALASLFTEEDVDNNDYCFVQIPTSDADSSEIAVTEKYKFNGTQWHFEYNLNTSGFNTNQWDALNSGITDQVIAGILERISALETAMGGMKIVKITPQAYSELQEKDSNTLYVLNE